MGEFYLKILSGNHIGAEIPLEPGQYSLGKGKTCDLILTDATLHDTELVIQITAEGQFNIFPKQEEEPVYHNGQPNTKPFTLSSFEVITTSNLHFTLGSADAEWPDILLPELQRPERPVESSDSKEESDDDDFPSMDDELPSIGIDVDDDDSFLDLDDDDSSYDLSDTENAGDQEDNHPPRPIISKKWLIAVPGVLISLILISIILLLSDAPPEEEEALPVNFSEQAIIVRDELQQRNVRIKNLPDNSILLTGYTATLKDKQHLQRNLRERGIPFSSQLVVMNELRANADTFLQNKGYNNIHLELDNTPGSLVMTGYIASVDELTLVINMLRQEIHGLVSIVDQVENQSSRFNTLKSMLRQKNLSARLHLSQKPNQITLEGHLLDDEQVYNLNDVVTLFRKRYNRNPVLVVATKSANGDSQAQGNQALLPSISIRGISMGRVPYVVMKDGGKYLIGAKLANGYIIEDINLEYLLLIKGTDRVKYRLGGNRGGSK